MRYRLLGGLRVSELALGTMTFGDDWTLSQEQLKKLDEASRIELGFPHYFYARDMVRAICYGGLYDQILA